MQKENVKRDNRILIDFWDQAFTLSEEQKAQLRNEQDDWKKLAPSEKLFQAAFSLGERKMCWIMAAVVRGQRSLWRRVGALMSQL